MKKNILFLIVMTLCILCAGCDSSLEKAQTTEDEIPVYSKEFQPDQNVPYYDDFSVEEIRPSNIPEYLLTVSKAKEMFASMEFMDYKESINEDGTLTCDTVSNTGRLTLNANGPGIVSSICYTTSASLPNYAGEYIAQFISICVSRTMTQDESESLLQLLSILQSGKEESCNLKISEISFTLRYDAEVKSYIVTWA